MNNTLIVSKSFQKMTSEWFVIFKHLDEPEKGHKDILYVKGLDKCIFRHPRATVPLREPSLNLTSYKVKAKPFGSLDPEALLYVFFELILP